MKTYGNFPMKEEKFDPKSIFESKLAKIKCASRNSVPEKMFVYKKGALLAENTGDNFDIPFSSLSSILHICYKR